MFIVAHGWDLQMITSTSKVHGCSTPMYLQEIPGDSAEPGFWEEKKGGREPPTGCSGPFGPPPAFAATQTGHIHINRLHHVYRKQINTTNKDSGNRIVRGRWDGASPEHRGRFAQPQAIRKNIMCMATGWVAGHSPETAGHLQGQGSNGGGACKALAIWFVRDITL